MPIGWLAAASVGGALINAYSSSNAADQQSAAAQQQIALQQQQNAQTRADLAPWTTSGVNSQNRLNQYLGIGGTSGSSTNDSSASNYGSLLNPFTGASLASEPGYQFGLNQGTQGINNANAAAGNYLSGGALKAITKYNQDYAGTQYNAAFQRDSTNKSQIYNFLNGVSSLGQNSAAMVGNSNQNGVNNINNSLAGSANAQAAASIAQGNALQSGINSGVNAYNNYQNNQNLSQLNQNFNNLLSDTKTGTNSGAYGPSTWTYR